MVYVRGRGFEMGLRLGQAREAEQKRKQYDEDRLRAISEHLEDRKRELDTYERDLKEHAATLKEHQVDRARAFNDRQTALGQERAQGEMNQLELGRVEQDTLQEAGIAPGTYVGPPSPNETAIKDYFARVGDVAKRMKPENRAQYLIDAKERFKDQRLTHARKEVAEGIQDRLAHGAFNFLDETEPNDAIMQRVEFLMKGLDAKEVDPVAASEMEGQLLESVRKENQRRLEVKRGTEMIDGELQKATQAGNEGLAQDMEALKAMWGTGELKPDDLVDRLFEAKHGRLTARAAGPTPFQVRTAAVRLWQGAHPGSTELPKEQEIQAIEQLLAPAPYQPSGLTREQVIQEATAIPGDRQTPEAGAPHDTAGASPGVPRSIGLVGNQAALEKLQRPPIPPTPKKGAKAAQARPWAKLKAKEQKSAETRLLSVAGQKGDLRAVLAELGIDPTSVPAALRKKLIEAAKKAATPTQEMLELAPDGARPGSGLGPGGG